MELNISPQSLQVTFFFDVCFELLVMVMPFRFSELS